MTNEGVGTTGDHYHHDDNGGDSNFRGIFVAMGLISLIPLVLWLLSEIIEFLFRRCTKIQRKPTLLECIQILDNYFDKNTTIDDENAYGDDNDPQYAFWYTNENDKEEQHEDEEVITNDSSGNIGDVSIKMPYIEDGVFASPPGTTKQRYNDYSKRHIDPIRYRNAKRNLKHMLHLHKTYSYTRAEGHHSTRRYLRGNFILALKSSMMLIVSCVMITFSLFALNTDPFTVLAFTGVAWAALWFQGGVVEISRNYLFHFTMLFSDKVHPGNIIMLDGYMKEFGCVYEVTPLYTLLLVERSFNEGRSEELLFLDISNYNFFVYPMLTAYRWKKPKSNRIKNTQNKIISMSSNSINNGTMNK